MKPDTRAVTHDIAFQLYRLEVVSRWPKDHPDRTVVIAAIEARLKTLRQ